MVTGIAKKKKNSKEKERETKFNPISVGKITQYQKHRQRRKMEKKKPYRIG